MQIYVVKPGDTLYQISRRFGIDIQSIATVNGLQQILYLIVGQALVIPSTETAYVVKPGDTLYSVSRRFGVSIGRIMTLNNITNPNLIYPGMVLRIPALAKNYGYIEVNGYLEPSGGISDTTIVNDVGRFFYIYVFSVDKLGIDVVSLFINFIPVVTVVSSYFILGEKMTPAQALGGAIIIFAVSLPDIEKRFKNRRVRRQA